MRRKRKVERKLQKGRQRYINKKRALQLLLCTGKDNQIKRKVEREVEKGRERGKRNLD